MALRIVKFNGLTKRWIVNVLSVLFIFLMILETVVSFIVYTYYNNSVADYLLGELDSISTSFNNYSSANSNVFSASAKVFTEDFENRDNIEVQFLNKNGNVMMSTSGFIMINEDIRIDNKSVTPETMVPNVAYSAKLKTGEHIMIAKADIVSESNSNIDLGSVRVLVSLRETNRQIMYIIFLTIVAGLIVFLIIMAAGMYFIRSIIRPVRNIGEITRHIASGDFDARIEAKNDDEIGRLCDSINHMAEELSSSERMKNEFISSVSHELRTPLTAIKGWAETVQNSYDDPEITKKGLGVIIGESERLSALVEELLDFSRLQNGQMSFKLENCDVIAELSEAVLTYTDAASRAGIELVYNEPENVPPITADASRLQQVFINIIDNAIKYTPSGGVITVSAGCSNGFIIISISDTGSGIPEDELDKVKQKFYKGRHATRGSGIGLAVAEEIVKKHGGLLDIASTEHIGTVVTITLPVDNTTESGENTKK